MLVGAKANNVTTIVRQPSGDQLLISACGRTCSIDMSHSRSMVDLQAALQRTLQMEGQGFHICDINGALLSTDMQVQDAIAQGLTPLCATLPDKSLHHLENRREELAQMQWKLVRDQMTQSNNQVTTLTRQLNELQYQVQAVQGDCQHSVDNFRMETLKALDLERYNSKAEIQPVQEAVNGAILLINGERSKRELSVQGFEKHIHGVCDMLDGERASRRQDLAMHMSVMQELRTSLDSERTARNELEESIKDLKRSTDKSIEELKSTVREQAQAISKIQFDASTNLGDIMGRFVELEDRCGSVENSLSETTAWTTGSLDKLGERHERVSQATETLRFTTKHFEGSIANCLERMNELDSTVRSHTAEMDNSLSQEKQLRDDQVRRVQQVFSNENNKQITELEKRLTIRLERESAEREKNFQFMIDEVTRVVEDRRLFRDQTITKTVTVPGDSSFRPNVVEKSIETPRGSYQPSSNDLILPDGTQERAYPLRGSAAGSTIGTGGPPRSRSQTPQKAMVVQGGSATIPWTASTTIPLGSGPLALAMNATRIPAMMSPTMLSGSQRVPLAARGGSIGGSAVLGSPKMGSSVGSSVTAPSATAAYPRVGQVMQIS